MVAEIKMTADNRPLFIMSFEDKSALYQQYMPFIQNGALFIRTSKTFCLGDEVSLSLALPSEDEQHHISGRVVWITPSAAERGLAAGIGVQLMGEGALPLHHKIETQLVGLLNAAQHTDTL